MTKYSRLLYDFLLASDLSESTAKYLNMAILLVALIVILWVANFITRRILINAFISLTAKTSSDFDDLLVEHGAPNNVAHIVPLIIAIRFFPVVFYDFQKLEEPLETLLDLYTVFLIIWIIRSVLKTFESYFMKSARLKDKPISSYIQVVMIIVWVIGLAAALSVLTDIEPKTFFKSLGAASAVLLLIFKDTILGFVASIQFAVNDTIRIGDWITMQKYGADGDVKTINLNNVQVQNFDKTITIIPTYAFMSEAYTNWRGMEDSDGRRIKRSIILKAKSVHYLTEAHIENLKKIELITEYLTNRQTDIIDFNSQNSINKSTLINGRNMTNLGVFRKYLQNYIENHSAINKDMIIMIRQLAPTSQGLPLEIYAFSSDKRWENYEYIMSDVFDHAIAAVSYFDLEIFELSAGIVETK